MTYAQICRWADDYLKEKEVPDSGMDAWYLMEYCFGLDRTRYLMKMTEEVPPEQLERYQDLVYRRGERIPLQHLTGCQAFMDFVFQVNEHVLIPRQDTEILVEQALAHLKHRKEPLRVLDLCTGSGCIIISLKKYCPDILAEGIDLSGEALDIAKKNAKELEADVAFYQSDLFSAVKGSCYLIVSNPPYIARKVIAGLMPEVKDHEPYMALDGGDDGLDFYRQIIEESPDHLEEDGMLMLEIGHDQAEAVAELMKKRGFDGIRVIQDLAGLDRVVSGYYRRPEKE